MTWLELAGLMQSVKRQLAVHRNIKVPLAKGSDSLQHKYVKVEKSTRAGVDAAVRRFARDLQLPEVEPLEGYFLFQRVDYIEPFVLLLALCRTGEENPIFPNPPPEFDDATQIEWLLDAGWKALGYFWWLGRMSGSRDD